MLLVQRLLFLEQKYFASARIRPLSRTSSEARINVAMLNCGTSFFRSVAIVDKPGQIE